MKLLSSLFPTRLLFILFLLAFSIGIFLRVDNISGYKFYPDSYYSLIVTENIQSYRSVLGYLGPEGMFYPDFFMWTRPGYPLLILLASTITDDSEAAALGISVVSGVISLLIAFFFLRSVFGKTTFAVTGLFLLSLSYTHTVWSGFIMTEGPGVCFMLLFLLSLFTGLTKKTSLANGMDFLTGGLFACAVLTRYEYAIILIPTVILIFTKSPNPLNRLINIFASLLFVIAIALSFLFPLNSLFQTILMQLEYILWRGGIVGVVFVSALFIWLLTPQKYKSSVSSLVNIFTRMGLILFTSVILFQLAFPGQFTLFAHDLTFFRNFFIDDMLMSISAFVGLSLMLRNSSLKHFALFFIFSTAALSTLYHQVNPLMDRYLTHIIPFLLVPGGYGLIKIKEYIQEKLQSKTDTNQKTLGVLLGVSLVLLFVYQFTKTMTGLKETGDKTWFQMSYEEKAARMTQAHVPQDSYILIASFPEPYYLYTRLSTYSLIDRYPYIFIDQSLDTRPVLIVMDMGMRDIFPNFSSFLEKQMSGKKLTEFFVGQKYHYAERSEDEKYPTVIYETTVKDLKNEIKKTSR